MLIKKKKYNFFLRLLKQEQTRQVLISQLANYDKLHADSFIKEIINTYLEYQGQIPKSIDELTKMVEFDLEIVIIEELNFTVMDMEAEQLMKLFNNRNKFNNKILMTLLSNKGNNTWKWLN